MKNFSNDRREGGYKGGDRGGKPGFVKKAWSNDRPPQLFKATCAECGKMCEVPFRPDGSKPVYCTDCFNKKRDPSDTRSSRDYSAPKPYPSRDFNDRFAPRAEVRSDRPAFKPVSENVAKQLSDIAMKLDRVLNAMEKMTAPQPKADQPRAEKAIPETALIKESKPKAPKKEAKAKPAKKVAKKKK